MYGSSLTIETLIFRDSRIAAREAAAMPLPREETTPPVTNTYLVIGPTSCWKFSFYAIHGYILWNIPARGIRGGAKESIFERPLGRGSPASGSRHQAGRRDRDHRCRPWQGPDRARRGAPRLPAFVPEAQQDRR